MIETIRALVAEHGRLSKPLASLGNSHDLYEAGLTSFAAVQLMLAVEERFGVAFPDYMLSRRSFASVDALTGCICALSRKAA